MTEYTSSYRGFHLALLGSLCSFSRPLLSQVPNDFADLFEGRFEIFNDFLGEYVGIGKVGVFFASFVSRPEAVEVGLDATDEFLVKVRVPTTIGITKKVET
jgi:hypothetical protein